ncbi:hypothetical protein DERF_007170 [Dermatophagoides farinae]|uniref:Endoplasmic reticulum lectin 1 n=1 Tax=Dermatophagoides farinae TaxID=6954 RepID=A0A922L2U6_DERFA|nr:hypothetical protein DERF_007170 [Dermatophagoides farinae]
MFLFIIWFIFCNGIISCNEEFHSSESQIPIASDFDSNSNNQHEPQSLFSFDDATLYKINWLDSTDSQNSNETLMAEELILTNENQHKYRCIIPNVYAENKRNVNATKNDDLNPYQLLKPLFTKKICSYRPENYWKYEICHGKYIRQFHEDPGIKVNAIIGYLSYK